MTTWLVLRCFAFHSTSACPTTRILRPHIIWADVRRMNGKPHSVNCPTLLWLPCSPAHEGKKTIPSSSLRAQPVFHPWELCRVRAGRKKVGKKKHDESTSVLSVFQSRVSRLRLCCPMLATLCCELYGPRQVHCRVGLI
ncbi:hypothetical protein QBC34DRAFT_47130 [Podospora aff. communis PSN243]|uniref:Secreted protein n=1 Tax=Podospora aff. communis PSN243 TaxID=3040156 RepID=A0AAV9GZC3_9PEZI|nr:hypothetical protein QBC34DRAFT_47130 [Podospora aff. communis PSN243]